MRLDGRGTRYHSHNNIKAGASLLIIAINVYANQFILVWAQISGGAPEEALPKEREGWACGIWDFELPIEFNAGVQSTPTLYVPASR